MPTGVNSEEYGEHIHYLVIYCDVPKFIIISNLLG